MSSKDADESPIEEDTLSKVITSMRSAFNKPIKRKQVKAKLAKMKLEFMSKESCDSKFKQPGNQIDESEDALDEKEPQEREHKSGASNDTVAIQEQEESSGESLPAIEYPSSPGFSRSLRRLRRQEGKEPKPRIVLTIRREEEIGKKCKRLKIVDNEDNPKKKLLKETPELMSPNEKIEETNKRLSNTDEVAKKSEISISNLNQTSLSTRPARKINPTPKAMAYKAYKELEKELEEDNNAKQVRRSTREKKPVEYSDQLFVKFCMPELEAQKKSKKSSPSKSAVVSHYSTEKQAKVKYLKKLGLQKNDDTWGWEQGGNSSDNSMDSVKTVELTEHLAQNDTMWKLKIRNTNELEIESEMNIIKCLCEEPCQMLMPTFDGQEPYFCGAVSSVWERRAGCSELALTQSGSVLLFRCGLSVNFTPLCGLHLAQQHRHMCCPKCGLFCTEGIVYQCSMEHYFHLECAYGSPDACPHCGRNETYNKDGWLNLRYLNSNLRKVKIQLHNKNIVFLPEQRIECTNAYMSFNRSEKKCATQLAMPEDFMPNLYLTHSDLERLKKKKKENKRSEAEVVRRLCFLMKSKSRNDKHDIIECISEINPNMRLSSARNGTFVHLAVHNTNLLAVFLLHFVGADLNMVDCEQRTPMMLAIEKITDVSKKMERESEDMTSLKILEFLCWAGASKHGVSLQSLAAIDAYDVLKVLLECGGAGASPDDVDQGGWTPLVWAAENNHKRVVQLLLDYGADVGICDVEGNGALHWCAQSGSAASMHLILKRAPHLIDQPNAHGETPLHMAARKDHFTCVVLLLTRDAKIDVKNKLGETPLDCAAENCSRMMNMTKIISSSRCTNPEKTIVTDISNGRERVPISCVNGVDDEEPPNFNYITENVFTEPILIDNSLQTLQGCDCQRSCTGTCSCTALSVKRWLRHGRLESNFPHHDPPMLFECNASCRCNAIACDNRSIGQLLREGATWVPATVFRVGGESGWGLRASVSVAKGTPVAMYAGEVLTTSKAEHRRDDHYIFAIEVNNDLLEECRDRNLLSVDASSYGSAARFINHSCEPNLAPVQVFITQRDLRLPHIIFFSTKDIRAGEQLTFDYGDKFWSVKSKILQCLCGSSSCRYSSK